MYFRKMCNPDLVYVLSGKRKSGKDYVAEKLLQKYGSKECEIIRLSAPLKHIYALENNLDGEKLLQSCGYKEKYRYDMIKWGEEKRQKNAHFFCKLAVAKAENKRVRIISDARRLPDIEFFVKNYKNVVLVRIEASEDVRTRRGWTFTPGVDDKESECALDCDVAWDFIFTNNFSQSEDKLFNDKMEELLLIKGSIRG